MGWTSRVRSQESICRKSLSTLRNDNRKAEGLGMVGGSAGSRHPGAERRIAIVVAGPPDDDSGFAHIVLTQSDGTTTDGQGSLLGATRLASDLGLRLVMTSDETFRWE